MDFVEQLTETRDFLQKRINMVPVYGIILGSGLGDVVSGLKAVFDIDYDEIPYFAVSTVKGHRGRLICGDICGVPVLVMQGRFHYYEGFNMKQVTFPVRVMGLLGIKALIVTNAAGAINESFEPGDLMVITDHINLMGTNPLMGPNLDMLGPRFPSMHDAYSKRLRQRFLEISGDVRIKVQQGVYAGLSGPAYETPAEIRMLRVLGADAVGMSTVPEVIAAVHQGMEVLGVSCITNMASGHSGHDILGHQTVINTANKSAPSMMKLITEFIRRG